MTSSRSGLRAILLLPAVVLVVSLAACAPATTTASSAPPTVTPSATPTVAPNTPPAIAFGGSCEQILPDAEATAFLGAPVTVSPATILGPADYAIPSVGGTQCYWNDPTSKGNQFLNLVVLPATFYSSTDKALDCSDDDGTSECYFNVVDSGYWFSGFLIAVKGATDNPSPAATKSVETLLAASAKAAGPAPSAVPVAGAWTKPTSCDALNQAAGIVSASGSPGLQANPLDTQSDSPDAYYTGLTSSGYFGCSYSDNSTVPAGKLQGFTVELAPGGAWAQKVLFAPTAANYTEATVTVPGADAAYTFSNAQGIQYLEVFDGVNWVAFEPYGGPISVAQLTPVIAGILKALN